METEILTVELPTELLNELREYTSDNVHDSIVKAVQMYVARFPDPGLEERLKAGYLANAEADAALDESEMGLQFREATNATFRKLWDNEADEIWDEYLLRASVQANP